MAKRDHFVDLDMHGQKITNLAEPTNTSDAATKNYVDSNSGGSSNSEELVFIGKLKYGETITSNGWQNLPLEVVFDPKNGYNPTDKTYDLQTANFHRFSFSLNGRHTNIEGFRSNSAAASATIPINFSCEYLEPNITNTGSLNNNNRALTCTVSNSPFDTTALAAQRGYWTVRVYDTGVAY